VLWHDALGMSLYAKRLERGKFIWPSPTDGVVVITPAQLACQSASKNDPWSASNFDSVWRAGF
jgi:transposase